MVFVGAGRGPLPGAGGRQHGLPTGLGLTWLGVAWLGLAWLGLLLVVFGSGQAVRVKRRSAFLLVLMAEAVGR
jgi:hypothetical protein